MRVLLDECVPRPLRRELPGHDVRTVPEMGWCGLKNAALLTAASAAGIDVLLTLDQNLRYEQNLSQHQLALVVLVTPSSRLKDLLPLMDNLRRTLNHIRPGDFVRICP